MILILFVLGCVSLNLPPRSKGLESLIAPISSRHVLELSGLIKNEDESSCRRHIDNALRVCEAEAMQAGVETKLSSPMLREAVAAFRNTFISAIAYDMLAKKHPHRCEVLRAYRVGERHFFYRGYNILHVAVLLSDHKVFNEFFNLDLLNENELDDGLNYNPLELLLFLRSEKITIDFLEKTKECLTNEVLAARGALHIAASMYYEKLVEYLLRERNLDSNKRFSHTLLGISDEIGRNFEFSVIDAMNHILPRYTFAKCLSEEGNVMMERNAILLAPRVPDSFKESIFFPIINFQSLAEKVMNKLIYRYRSRTEGEIDRLSIAYSNIVSMLRDAGYMFQEERGFMEKYHIITGEALYLGGEAIESLLRVGLRIDMGEHKIRLFDIPDEVERKRCRERTWPCMRLDTLDEEFVRGLREGLRGRREAEGTSSKDLNMKSFRRESEIYPNWVEFVIRFSRRLNLISFGFFSGSKTFLDLMKKEKFADRFIDLAIECGFKTGAQLRRSHMAHAIREMLEAKREEEKVERAKEPPQKERDLPARGDAAKAETHATATHYAKSRGYDEMDETQILLAFERILVNEDYEELRKIAPLIDLEGLTIDWSMSKDERVRKLLIRQGTVVDKSLLLSVFELNQIDVAKLIRRETIIPAGLLASMRRGELRYNTSLEMARIFGSEVEHLVDTEVTPEREEPSEKKTIEFEIFTHLKESYIEDGLMTERVVERLKDMKRGRFGDVKKLDGEIWEARLLGHSEVGNTRIYYRARENKIFILAIVYKGEDKISQQLMDRIMRADVGDLDWQPAC